MLREIKDGLKSNTIELLGHCEERPTRMLRMKAGYTLLGMVGFEDDETLFVCESLEDMQEFYDKFKPGGRLLRWGRTWA